MVLSVNKLLYIVVGSAVVFGSLIIYYNKQLDKAYNSGYQSAVNHYNEQQNLQLAAALEKSKRKQDEIEAIRAAAHINQATLLEELDDVKAKLSKVSKADRDRECFNPVQLQQIRKAAAAVNKYLHNPGGTDDGLQTDPDGSGGKDIGEPARLAYRTIQELW